MKSKNLQTVKWLHLFVESLSKHSRTRMMIEFPDLDDGDYGSVDPKMEKFYIKGRSYNIGPVYPDRSNQWELAELAADFAASVVHEQGGNALEFKGLLKAVMEIVSGVMYYLTFSAVDLSDQIEKIYRAKVWAKVPSGLEFMFCEECKVCNKSPEEMRIRINEVLARLGKKPRPSLRFLEEEDTAKVKRTRKVKRTEYPEVIEIRATHKDLSINGFCFLMKEIREQNPTWKYNRVRKAASKKWRTVHRLPYMLKAKQKFWDKNRYKSPERE